MSAAARIVLPSSGTIGVLGNGQLGRMMALAARRMGYRVHTFGPGAGSPTGQVADREFVAEYEDLEAVTAFAKTVDVVTFEFENVSSVATDAASVFTMVRPAGSVLHTTQNRLREKQFLQMLGCATAPFAPIRNSSDIAKAITVTGLPSVLKTAGSGYDGKGQRIAGTQEEVTTAWEELGRVECILEGFIDFAYEASVVAVRGADGSYADYGLVLNHHAHHILDVTTAPAPNVPPAVVRKASEMARAILSDLQVVGVLCVELFVTQDGELIVNELAPRPHNSGHWTIEACPSSQFEQQLRAVCGLPLGKTTARQPAAMANLLGDLWVNGEPDWQTLLGMPDIYLHLYGKTEPRPGRKMGHLTTLAATPEAAARRVKEARETLTRVSGS